MSSERSGRLSLPLLPLPLCVVENPDFIVPTFHPWSTYACQKTRAWPVCPVALCWDPSSHGGLRSQHWAAGEGSSTRRSRTAFWLAMPSSPLSLPLPPEKCFVYLHLGGDSEGDVIATIMVVRRLWKGGRWLAAAHVSGTAPEPIYVGTEWNVLIEEDKHHLHKSSVCGVTAAVARGGHVLRTHPEPRAMTAHGRALHWPPFHLPARDTCPSSPLPWGPAPGVFVTFFVSEFEGSILMLLSRSRENKMKILVLPLSSVRAPARHKVQTPLQLLPRVPGIFIPVSLMY